MKLCTSTSTLAEENSRRPMNTYCDLINVTPLLALLHFIIYTVDDSFLLKVTDKDISPLCISKTTN